MDSEWKSAGYDVIYLAGCTINQITPDRGRTEAMDPEKVCRMSRYFSLSALTYRALDAVLPVSGWNPDAVRHWKEAHDRAFFREVRFGGEREKIYAFLEGEGTRYMPLKGIVLRDFYPECYLREMADNDILFEEEYRQRLHRWFLERGYTAEDYGVGNCDVYQKKPIYNFEMHTTPFAFFEEDAWREYDESFWDRLIPDGEGSLRSHLSDEDFYVYITLHSFKHYKKNGIGVRSLLDCYLYNRAAGGGLDREYIQAELTRLGAAEYEERTRTLSGKLFTDPENFSPALLSGEERGKLEEFISAGTNGTVENMVSRGMPPSPDGAGTAGRGKLGYVCRRLFPSAKYMASYAPVLEKHRWLIPAGYVYRIARGIRKHRADIRSEIRILRKM